MWYWLLPIVAVAALGGSWTAMIRIFRREDRHGRDGRAMIDLSIRPATEDVYIDEMRRHPDSAIPGFVWIDRASQAADYTEAWRRTEEVARQFPKHPDVYGRQVSILMAQGRLDEAEKLAERSMRRFPRSEWLRVCWIDIPGRRGDQATTLARAEKVRRDHPTEGAGYTRAIWIFLERQQFDEAAEVAAAGLRTLEAEYDKLMLIRISGQIAEHRGDLAEAAEQWTTALEADPSDAGTYRDAIRVLRLLSRNDEADDLVQRASVRFPDNADIRALAAHAAG